MKTMHLWRHSTALCGRHATSKDDRDVTRPHTDDTCPTCLKVAQWSSLDGFCWACLTRSERGAATCGHCNAVLYQEAAA